MDIKEAIEVLKKFKEWANTPINGSSKYDLIKLFGSIDTVVAEVEKPTYTPADMEALMNWMAENAFPSELKGYWILNGTGEEVTTTQLREIWEQSRKEATE